MAKPLRSLARPRNSARRRHRTWMRSMSVATLGWGLWWSALAWHRKFPDQPPPWIAIYTATCCLAGVGMFYAFFTLRAKKSWVIMATLAWVANLGLFVVPWVLHEDLIAFLASRAQ